VEARHQLGFLVYQVGRDTAEWGEKAGAATKERVESALTKAKEALKGDDLGTLNSARDELMQAFSAAGQEMYQAQAAESEAAASAEPGPGAGAGADERPAAEDEDVVEADYEIVEEEK